MFSFLDAGGDGLCCKHGKGSYEVSWDGNVLKEGAAFYKSETTSFGICGETDQPTKSIYSNAPSSAHHSIAGENGKEGGSSYKCLPVNLIDEGYEVSIDKCGLFENCFNQYINVGDDWFCKEDEQCINVPSCGGDEDQTTELNQAKPTLSPTQVSPSLRTNLPTVKIVPQRPTVLIPKQSISPNSIGTSSPTTHRPTIGPCSGVKCNEDDHCRSQFGFCGPGDTYCNENPIWTKNCTPVSSIPSDLMTNDLPIDRTAPTMHPSTEKPFSKPAFTKPGGIGSISKPARTRSPITFYPTPWRETNPPTEMMHTAVDQSGNPTSAPSNLFITYVPVTLPATEVPSSLETKLSSGNSGNPTSAPSNLFITYVPVTLPATEVPSSLETELSSGM